MRLGVSPAVGRQCVILSVCDCERGKSMWWGKGPGVWEDRKGDAGRKDASRLWEKWGGRKGKGVWWNADWDRWLDFPGGSDIKNLPAMQETWVWSLAGEDPLEKRMATHSSILACIIPWTEKPGRLQSSGSQEAGHDWVTNTVGG